ncbi:MAG: nitroreductase family protein [Candidatus Zixiibacteriota bacterium]
MNTIEAIRTRRSIRKYTSQPVGKEAITKILRAAMSAPSACNQQPWRFIIIDKRELLDKIPDIHKDAPMCQEANVAILICADPSLETCPGYWVQDCAAATMNLLLAAHDLGLGAVWTGVYPRDQKVSDIRKMFGLPAHIIPFALVPIGYPNEKIAPEDRYKEDRIRYNHW